MNTIDPSMLIDSLRTNRGKVAAVSRQLRISRQAVYHHIESNHEVSGALRQIRDDVDKAKKPVLPALKAIKLGAKSVAKEAAATGVSLRTAAREMVIAKLMADTGRSERDLMAEIRGSEKAQRALEDLLPPIDNSRGGEDRETMSTSLTAEQTAWIAGQPPGTVAALLAKTTTWPTVSDSTAEKKQTTFSVRAVDAARLRAAAADRKETTQTLIRQVIEVARREAQPSGRRRGRR